MKQTSEIAERSIYEMLNDYTVVELRRVLAHLSLKIKSGLRKAAIVKAIGLWLTAHPQEFLDHLLTYELRLYDDIINHPEKGTHIPGCLTHFRFDGLAFDGDKPVYYVAPELESVIAPLLPEAIARREESGEEKIENQIVGLLNLRGAMCFSYFCDIVCIWKDEDEALDMLFSRFKKFMSVGEADDEDEEPQPNEEPLMFESPYSIAVGFNPFDEYMVDPDCEPKEFSDEEIAKAAIMPFPIIGGRAYDRLHDALLRFGKSEEEAEGYMFERWLNKLRMSANPVDGIRDMAFDSFEQVQELLPLLNDYLNDMPFWKFKGWSSHEIAAKMPRLRPSEKPRITIGPNMRAMGTESWEQLEEMARRGEDFSSRPFTSAKKVGRNDPCSCGSGKKYKHCCGK